MEYGLDGEVRTAETPWGRAFAGVLDGSWTWSLDVLADGRTAMAPGTWPYLIIDRCVDQRLEAHALLAEVRGRPHRTFECPVVRGTRPRVR
jgi:hypothetical protein